MTKSQKITIRLSECRQKLNELLQVDDRTDEQQTELERLTGDVQKLEPELRAAIAAEPDPQTTTTQTEHADPETRERLELRGRARLGNFLQAALRGRVLDGVEGEYCASAFGSTLRGGYVDVPLDLFEADRPREVRADAPSTAPSTVGVMHQPVQPFPLRTEHRADARHRNADRRQRDVRRLDHHHVVDRRYEGQGRRGRIDGGRADGRHVYREAHQRATVASGRRHRGGRRPRLRELPAR